MRGNARAERNPALGFLLERIVPPRESARKGTLFIRSSTSAQLGRSRRAQRGGNAGHQREPDLLAIRWMPLLNAVLSLHSVTGIEGGATSQSHEALLRTGLNSFCPDAPARGLYAGTWTRAHCPPNFCCLILPAACLPAPSAALLVFIRAFNAKNTAAGRRTSAGLTCPRITGAFSLCLCALVTCRIGYLRVFYMGRIFVVCGFGFITLLPHRLFWHVLKDGLGPLLDIIIGFIGKPIPL